MIHRLCCALLYFMSVQVFALTEMALGQLELIDGVIQQQETNQPYTGFGVSFFANGQKQLQIQFHQGLRHGKETAWYESGQLRYIVRYKKGQSQSLGSSWYKQEKEETTNAGFMPCHGHAGLKAVCNMLEVQADSEFILCDGREDMPQVCGKLDQKPSNDFMRCDGPNAVAEVCGEQEAKSSSHFEICEQGGC